MTGPSRWSVRGGTGLTVPHALPGRERAAAARSRCVERPGAEQGCLAGGPQRGAVTVELVGVIPLLVVVTLAMVSLVAVARDQVLAQSAAREGAREAALGSGEARAVSAARAALPPGRPARVTVVPAGSDRVRVTVELGVRLPFGAPPVTVRAQAVALREPGPVPRNPGP
jgi:TadE-like protein